MNKKSFSLIEVLIFVTILVLFFVAALAITTYSLGNMKINEHKIIATRYAEESIEWLKSQKEENWTEFILKDTSSGTTYCLNELNWLTQSSCGENFTLGDPAFFKRELLLTNQSGTPTEQVNAQIQVSWQERNQAYDVTINTILTIWE